ncbi:MAG: Ger(x)C family spore germination protein [Eubacteriales bacterium]|nr:Ger(x)C family spore germination protein [Eubacteriales bacterium]
MIKKVLALFLILFAMLILHGCFFPEKHPIEDLQNILIAGIDRDGEDIVLTIVVDTINQSNSGENQIGAELYVATGKTVFEAKRSLHEYTEKRIVWYHLKYIIIGEEAAEQGIDPYLSFFCENNENRFSHRLIVAQGITAKDLVQQICSQEGGVSENIDSLFTETARTGKSSEITLLDYAITRERPWESLYIPVITLIDNPVAQKSDDTQGQDGESSHEHKVLLQLDGYALFDEDLLTCFLDGDSTRGINFVINELDSTGIVVQDDKGQNVSLEIIESKVSIKPDFDEPLSAAIEVVVKSNMVEYTENQDVGEEYITYLEQRQDAYIQNEIEQALTVIQQKKLDVIGMGDAFYHENVFKWNNIKEDWQNIFADLKITVKVTSDIKCTYSLLNAAGA